jgi:hypothetical protein
MSSSNHGGSRVGAGRSPLPLDDRAKPLTKVVRCPVGYERYVSLLPDLINLIQTYKENSHPSSPRWDKAIAFLDEINYILE